MNTDPSQETGSGPRARWQVWVMGIVIGDVVVGLLYGLGAVIMKKANTLGPGLGLLGLPSFFLMPAVGGLVASYFWGLDLSRVHDVKLEGIFAYLCIEKC